MRALKTVCWSGLALALVAGSPTSLAQNLHRERREQPQASPAQPASNDRLRREDSPRPAPAPQPSPAPRRSALQPSRPVVPASGAPSEALRQRPAAPSTPAPTAVPPPSAPAPQVTRPRNALGGSTAPQPTPTSRGTFTPAPSTPPSIAPALAPQTDRSRNALRSFPPQPRTNPDPRRDRQSPPARPIPDSSRPSAPTPQALPLAEASRSSPRADRAPRSPQGWRGDRLVLPPDVRRGEHDSRADRQDFRPNFREDSRGTRDSVTVYSSSRDYGPSGRRPVEIHRPRSRVDLSIAIGTGLGYHPRYEPICEPVRLVCAPVSYCPPRRHWYRPVWDSCSWDRWCEPRYVYNPYTLFPAPLWPGPSYTYSSWPYYSGSSLGFSLFTYGSSSRYSGSFFYSNSLPLYTSSTFYDTGFYDTSSPWYTSGSSSTVETFRSDSSASLSQAISTPADSGTGAIRVLSDAAPPATPAAAGTVASDQGFAAVHRPASVTIYRARDYGGTLAWSDSPTTILYAVASAARDARGEAAGQFLGRSPAGAWEVTYEKWRRTAIGPELTCRAALPNEAGWRATIVLRLMDQAIDPVERLRAGQRLSISGVLSELSVDDPNHPGGLLILEDGKMSQ